MVTEDERKMKGKTRSEMISIVLCNGFRLCVRLVSGFSDENEIRS